MHITQIDDLVAETGRLVAQHYVFKELGEELQQLLTDQHAAGHYQEVADPASLAGLVTADLQSRNGDLHLRLKYRAEEIPDLPDNAGLVEMLKHEATRELGGIAQVQRLPGNVAYLDLQPLLYPVAMSATVLGAALQVVAGADALILDLRHNRGGDPQTVAFICSYLFDEPTHLHTMYFGDGTEPRQSWTLPHVPGPRFGGSKPLAVLTGTDTFSGAEELAYDLQQHGRATLVGERTRGGAHPRTGYRIHPHLEVTVPTGRPVHPLSGTNWEGTGVEPDVPTTAEDALAAARSLLAQATRVTNPSRQLG